MPAACKSPAHDGEGGCVSLDVYVFRGCEVTEFMFAVESLGLL